MLYSIGQCCCMHSFFVRVSCFLCQFIAEFFSFQRVSPCSRWLQFVSGISSLFQMVSGSSNSCYIVYHFSLYATRHVRRFSPIFVSWSHAITWLSFLAWIYKLKNYWMNIKFLNENKFLNEFNVFEWNQNFWMKSLMYISFAKSISSNLL